MINPFCVQRRCQVYIFGDVKRYSIVDTDKSSIIDFFIIDFLAMEQDKTPDHIDHSRIRIVESRFTRDGHEKIIVKLLNDYACGLTGGGKALSEFTRANLVPELEKRPGTHAILAFVDDLPAGMAIAMEGFSTFTCKPLMNLHDMYVAPAYRGRGIADKLLQKVEAVARRQGCCKLTLEVLEHNVPAQKLYDRFGFVPYELDPALGRAMFMEKPL